MVIYHKTTFHHFTSYHHVVAFIFFPGVINYPVAFLGMRHMQLNAKHVMAYIPRAVQQDVHNLSGKLYVGS